ncbi:Short-chain dehydrogenase/reductase SDR [Trinorchestia longiramus]|nr:Short-chain dehydrogenase/reductase SDR [Trinorchestia longiramus]
MGTSYSTNIVVWVFVWCALALISQHSWALGILSVGLVAAHLSEWILKGIQNTRPRVNIKDISKKAVFVTGCDSGFGLELASTLAKMGFKVYAGCLDPDGRGPTTLKLQSSRIVALQCDVTKEDEVTEAYKLVADDLDIDENLWAVVNNAGIATFTEIEWCSLSTFRKQLEVNTLGPVLVTKTFLPLLRQNGDGARVIIVASLAGRYTFPGFSAYSMSKHAAVSFADCLRLEMRKWNISVHTVEPTLYRTPITNVENLHRSLDQTWQECPAEVRRSYGQEYLKDFKVTVNNHMSNAKPSEKIKEVIADMVDAVAGQEPLPRYVPSVETQIRCRLLSTLPAKMRDTLLLKGHPKTPPAFLAARHSYTPSERCDGPGARTREVIDLVVSLFQRAARNTRLCWTRVSDSASTVAAWPAITPCPTLRKTKSLRRRSQRRLKRTSLSSSREL